MGALRSGFLKAFRPAVLLAAAVSLAAPSALAFCRTTTCDAPAEKLPPECVPEQRDGNGCWLVGAELYWPTRCVGFGVQENGSKKQGIGWELADSVIRRAFTTWTSADCGGGQHPSLSVYDLDEVDGPMMCPSVEFNKSAPNANIWMFSDDEWPYARSALAITTTTFDETGRILDADVEINSFSATLTTSDTDIDYDLQSILTHETGHFLGLAHEKLEHATMNEGYQPGTLDFRSLAADDIAGICGVYPPNRPAPDCPGGPQPPHGFSRYCGGEDQTGTVRSKLSLDEGAGCTCSFDQSSGRTSESTLVLLGAVAVVLRRRFTKTMRGSHD